MTAATDSAPSAEKSQKDTPDAVAITQELHKSFVRSGVRCCHFKSNLHLAAGLAGQTDLDLLVDAQQRVAAERCLLENGFKSFRAIGHLAYPGVVDYLGMDEATGALVHLHLHFQLILGEKHLKGYRIPWEAAILANRRLDRECSFYASSIEWELMLLLVRAALKVRLRDHVAGMIGKPTIERGIRDEYVWLKERYDRAILLDVTQQHLGPTATPAVTALLDDGLSLEGLARLRRVIQPKLKHWRSHSHVRAWIDRHRNELSWLIGGLSRRIFNRARPTKRIPLTGGRVIALLGCDGSGKSTVLKELRRWLAWKIDVCCIYHGSGQGESSLLRWPMKMAHKLISRPKPDETKSDSSGQQKRKPRLKSMLRPVWAIALAFEKARKLRRQTRARNLGMIVLADRYPQTDVCGIHDGPLLDLWKDSGSRLLRSLSAWERSVYQHFAAYPPDLVLKLGVTVDESWRRKPEGTREQLQERIEAIDRIHVPALVAEVLIDANLAKDAVVLAAKREIWKLL